MPRPPNYRPSPPVNRTYSGPSVPAAYDPNWQLYNNLTRGQISWFQAQPEWQDFITYVSASPRTATAAASPILVNANKTSKP